MEAYEAIMAISRIFKTKKWFDKDNRELAFDGFCRLFTSLEPNQRELIVELADNYHWISHGEYQDRIIEAMQAISIDELSDVEKIYFFPIIKPGDENKAKSGDHLLYIIKAFKQMMPNYSHTQFEYLKTFEQITNLRLTPQERLFLVDDYIGSGETFDQCLIEIKKNPTLLSSLIKIVCIAVQEETQINLVMDGYAILTTLVLKRGISDFNVPPYIEEKKNLMREIERHIPGAKSFSLGYNETEALVTMARTPDNTFPVFWKKFRKEGKYFEAPFARYEEK
ncbi:MAG TPA: hypothetical protein VHE59_09070 [Mucilaginibacter sp.]|nr:hypothetical protein [Mucilaginibacter sp.]